MQRLDASASLGICIFQLHLLFSVGEFRLGDDDVGGDLY